MGEHLARRGGLGVAAALLVVAGLLVAGAVALDVLAEPAEMPAAEPVAIEAPSRGVLHCPVTAEEGETARLAVAAAGDEPSAVTVLRYEGGTPARNEPVEVAPGDEHVLALEVETAERPVGVTWEGGPAVATWAVAGRAAAPCEASAVPMWHVTGFDTTAQNEGFLHLFNPFAADAVVRVTFGTPTGPVALVLTDNVLVPARSSIRLDLNEYEPEQDDLAVTVEVLAGRAVAQGELRMDPTANQPGPRGRTLLPAVPAAEMQWAFGYARWAENDASWLSLYNPGDREAAVEVRVSDPLPDEAVRLRELAVPAGGVVRVELDEVSAGSDFGVAVAVLNDVPVVAARMVHAQRGQAEDVAASVGRTPGASWALAGGRADARLSSLNLYNPGAEPVRVRVEAGAGSPSEWAAVDVAPNSRVGLDLDEAGADRTSVPLRVTADGDVVADLRMLRTGEQLGLWTAAAVPAADWEGPGERPPVRRDATLVTVPLQPEAAAGPE